MIVNEQKPITFSNPLNVIFDEKLLAEAVLWYADTHYAGKPVVGHKTVYMWGRYPAVAIHHSKVHVHRLVYGYHHDHHFTKGEYVHHKDGNRKNADITNLELMDASEHQRITNKGRKQSAEHVAKRTAAMKRTRYENPELLTNPNPKS